jgi:hypothetical protein
MHLEPNTITTAREYNGNVEFPELHVQDEIGWVEHLDILAYGYQKITGRQHFKLVKTQTLDYVTIGILPL